MNILAIDTSSSVASVAIINNEKLVGEYSINTNLKHSEKLMPIINQLLLSCDISINDIDCIGIAEGPGSFTGVRIGIATARAISHVINVPIIGVSTLEALAYNIPCFEGIVCPILDARRNQVYASAYRWEDNNVFSVINQDAYYIDDIIDELNKYNEKIIFLGDGIDIYKEKLVSGLGVKAKFSLIYTKLQRASSVAQLALKYSKKGEMKNCFQVLPNYLRKSEAERQYEAKIKGIKYE